MNKNRKIFACGAGLTPRFLKYLVSLTGKTSPKVCFLPTAVGDNPNNINTWYERSVSVGIIPFVQRMFISSYDQKESFEDFLLGMDAIVVSGGNTVNMLAIWKAQGIDTILHKAWDNGIVLAGGSAGSLCWFEHGTTDSRPKVITQVDCLGFLPGSHCPHYDSEPGRRPLYHSYIQSKSFKAGYACDDQAGILFEDQAVKEVVALQEESNVYYVFEEDGIVKEQKLDKIVLA